MARISVRTRRKHVPAPFSLTIRGGLLLSIAVAVVQAEFDSKGWQLAIVMQAQSGNPVNIVYSNSTFTGVANTLRPDVRGPIAIIGVVDRWFDTSVFSPVSRFGNLGRNVVVGPEFNNTDFSIMKNTELGDKIRVQFRAEASELFNHAHFGQPENVIGAPGFGRITNTRFPTGESGSSRQMQLGIKLLF